MAALASEKVEESWVRMVQEMAFVQFPLNWHGFNEILLPPI